MGPSIIEVIAGLGTLGAFFWIGQLVEAIKYRSGAVWLEDVPDEPPAEGWPSLAVVFAARDEAAMVEPATVSILDQDYPELEVVAVDDRSSDGTGAILDAIAARDRRLTVIHVADLPE